MLVSKEKEMESIAKKVAVMEPQSIRTLIFTADVLLARDRMEHMEKEQASCATQSVVS